MGRGEVTPRDLLDAIQALTERITRLEAGSPAGVPPAESPYTKCCHRDADGVSHVVTDTGHAHGDVPLAWFTSEGDAHAYAGAMRRAGHVGRLAVSPV